MKKGLILAAVFAVGAAAAALATFNLKSPPEGEVNLHAPDVEATTRQLVRYYDTISLTPEQQRVKEAALKPLPAACCKGFSALTCCCKCNLSRSVWGLTHYLIARRGANAEQVQAAVKEWLAVVNPSGFTGTSCTSGHCGSAFAEDGCGGMHPNDLVF